MNRLIMFFISIFSAVVLYGQEMNDNFLNVKYGDVSDNSLIIEWNKIDDAVKYIIQYNIALNQADYIENETSDTVAEIHNLLPKTHYLFRMCSINAEADSSNWTDWVSVYTLGYDTDCAEIESINVYNVDNNKLWVRWNGDVEDIYWEVVCGAVGDNPQYAGQRVVTDNMECYFSHLNNIDTYQIAIRTHCKSSIGNWKYLYTKRVSTDIQNNIPLEINFEDSSDMYKVGFVSSLSNNWIISDKANTDSLNYGTSLYISKDGNLLKFDKTKQAHSYAYIDFTVQEEAIGYYIEFWYKSYLESDIDGMRAYIMDVGSDLSTEQLPDNIYKIGKALYNNTEGYWHKEHIECRVNTAADTKRLVFAWYNTDTVESDESLIIDNIRIIPRYCPEPDSVIVKNITSHSAEVYCKENTLTDSYNILYKEAEEQTWNIKGGVANGYVLDGLKENTLYFYRVQASCNDDSSLYSAIDSFVTAITVKPVSVDEIKYSTKYNEAFFEWTEDKSVHYYIIHYKKSLADEDWKEIISDVNSCVLSDLESNSEYIFRVCKVNFNNDTSKFSEDIYFMTDCAPITEYPYLNQEILTIVPIPDTNNIASCYSFDYSALITPVFDFTNLSVPKISFDVRGISSLYIYISKDGGKNFVQITEAEKTPPNEEDYVKYSVVLSDYVKENNVVFKFVSYSDNLNDTDCKIKNIYVDNACSSPVAIFIDSLTAECIKITWTKSSEVDAWRVHLLDSDNNIIDKKDVDENYYIYDKLKELSDYIISIKSICSGDESADSSLIYFTVPDYDATKCPVPGNFSAYWFPKKDDETILATWDSTDGSQIWEVYYRQLYAVEWNSRIVTVSPVFSVRNVSEGEVWLIKVRTICASGDTSDFTATDTVYVGVDSYLLPAEENHVYLYPNPTRHTVNVIKTNNVFITDAVLSDIGGNIINRWGVLPDCIDMTLLPAGSYVLKGYIRNKYTVFKIIKR